jgi:hypothetical protein
MKRFLCFIVIAASIMSCSSKTVVYKPKPNSTSTTSTGKIPPGQMKKITGEQSAKSYAPGQQKKATTTTTTTTTTTKSKSNSSKSTGSTKSSDGNSGKGNGNSKKKE